MTLSTLDERKGLLLVLSSPSGAGKSTLSKMLIERDPRFRLSVSATTRPPRSGETDGIHYFFVDHERFEEMASAGEMLEHAHVFGNRYGTPRAPVEAAVSQGQDVLFDVDWQGTQQLRASILGHAVVSIFILPPSIAALEQRLLARGQDEKSVINDRMSKSRAEISHWAEYDYVLINDSLDACFSQIETIVAAERLRLKRQKGISQHVESLNHEFDRRERS